MKRIIIVIAMAVPSLAMAQEPAAILKHDGWVAAVAFAPDGKTLASAGADNVVRLWEVGTWKPKGVLKGHTDCVCAIAFDDTGRLLASGSFDHTAKVWGITTLKPALNFDHPSVVGAVWIRELPGLFTGDLTGTVRLCQVRDIPGNPNNLVWAKHKSWVNSIAVHHEQARVASGSSDGTVKLDKKYLLEGGAGEVRCVAFSPDGKLLAAGNRYHTVRVWDVNSKKEVTTLKGHMSDVWSIAFSPDGKTLAAADTDWRKPSKVKLWDTATWKERGSLDVPGEILALAYSPKGDWLAVGSWDKTVRVFAIGK